MCLFGPPSAGRRPVQATSLPRSDCSSDTTVTGPPLVAWLAAPVASVPLDEREPVIIGEGAA